MSVSESLKRFTANSLGRPPGLHPVEADLIRVSKKVTEGPSAARSTRRPSGFTTVTPAAPSAGCTRGSPACTWSACAWSQSGKNHESALARRTGNPGRKREIRGARDRTRAGAPSPRSGPSSAAGARSRMRPAPRSRGRDPGPGPGRWRLPQGRRSPAGDLLLLHPVTGGTRRSPRARIGRFGGTVSKRMKLPFSSGGG